MNRSHLAGLLMGVLALGAATTLVVEHVRAAGIPAGEGALTYTGYLEDGNGAPVTTEQMIGLAVYDSSTAGSKVCEVDAKSKTPVGGWFEIRLQDKCVDAVSANPELWVEVSVGAIPLGRTKLGAVPYAVEAGHATSASAAVGDLKARLDGLTNDLGKVTAALQPKSAMRAHMGATRTPPAGTWSPIIYDQVDYDMGAEYDRSTGVFTAKQAGYYLVTCSVYLSSNDVGPAVALEITGERQSISQSAIMAPAISGNVSTVVKLEASAAVACNIEPPSSSSVQIAGDKGWERTNNAISVTRLYP